MKAEEGWGMYIDIQRLKSKGFSNSKIASKLGISRPTVIKYVKMNTKEFEEDLESKRYRVKKPDIYQMEILSWLKQFLAYWHLRYMTGWRKPSRN